MKALLIRSQAEGYQSVMQEAGTKYGHHGRLVFASRCDNVKLNCICSISPDMLLKVFTKRKLSERNLLVFHLSWQYLFISMSA